MTFTLGSAILSAAIGKASGLRSSVGVSAVLLTRFVGTKRERLAIGASVIATAGELVGDKLPSTPSRLDPAPLGGRIVAGGAAAYTLARRRGDDPIPAILIGGVSAIAGSYAGAAYRTWAAEKIPPIAAAVVEDIAALAIAGVVVNVVLD